MLPPTVLALGEHNFHAYVADLEVPLVVHYCAPWCTPCLMLKPIFEQAAALRRDLRFAVCDVDAAPEIGRNLEIANVPTLAIYLAGRERARISGTMRLGGMLDWLDRQRGAAPGPHLLGA